MTPATTTAAAELDCHGLTNPGKRHSNEDQFVVASMRKSVEVSHTSLPDAGLGGRLEGPNARLLAVADGVGGQPGGELASAAVVEHLLEYVSEAAGSFQRLDVEEEQQFLDRLEQNVRYTHGRILAEHGRSHGAPATTLTVALVVGLRAYLIHVGDSRAYYLRRGRLRQITQDQTVGAYMVDVGAWTDEQAARSRTGESLASAVGGSELTPSVGLIDLEPGDVFLLCTDGLTKHVPDADIGRILGSAGSAETACRELIAQALEGGGSDNVTVVVARCVPSPPAGGPTSG
ncbi:MAG: PP2C family protein-serine/threonine phosphatase [Gemmatimonadales bacterium]